MDRDRAILIIDDDAVNRILLSQIFEDSYEILEAGDGEEGRAVLRERSGDIAAILLDYMMPRLDGLGFLRAEAGLAADIPVFLITAEDDVELVRAAYGMGVMDVIQKPVVPFIVRRRIESVIELFEGRRRLSRTVDRQAEKIIALSRGMIEALTSAIEFRSLESGDHVRRIHDITLFMLEETSFGDGLASGEKEQIALASIMHDVGKIAIPDAILKKPGRLSEEEFEIMKGHTVQGAHLLESIPQFRELEAYAHARDIALHHHERWDGRGYPEGLKGDGISVPSQIVALADVYDALQSRRCYKDAFSRQEAVDMIVGGKCGAFNPALLDAFLKVEDGLYAIFETGGKQ